jgi:hypothetical protein
MHLIPRLDSLRHSDPDPRTGVPYWSFGCRHDKRVERISRVWRLQGDLLARAFSWQKQKGKKEKIEICPSAPDQVGRYLAKRLTPMSVMRVLQSKILDSSW